MTTIDPLSAPGADEAGQAWWYVPAFRKAYDSANGKVKGAPAVADAVIAQGQWGNEQEPGDSLYALRGLIASTSKRDTAWTRVLALFDAGALVGAPDHLWGKAWARQQFVSTLIEPSRMAYGPPCSLDPASRERLLAHVCRQWPSAVRRACQDVQEPWKNPWARALLRVPAAQALLAPLLPPGTLLGERPSLPPTALSAARNAWVQMALRNPKASELLVWLAAEGLDATRWVSQEGQPALHWAARKLSVAGVEALLAAGADPKALDAWGQTAVQACQMGVMTVKWNMRNQSFEAMSTLEEDAMVARAGHLFARLEREGGSAQTPLPKAAPKSKKKAPAATEPSTDFDVPASRRPAMALKPGQSVWDALEQRTQKGKLPPSLIPRLQAAMLDCATPPPEADDALEEEAAQVPMRRSVARL